MSEKSQLNPEWEKATHQIKTPWDGLWRWKTREGALHALETGDYSNAVTPFTPEWETAPFELRLIKSAHA